MFDLGALGRALKAREDARPTGDSLRGALTDNRSPQEREEAIRRHLEQVPEHDHALAAVREILSLRLIESASLAGALGSEDRLKLRSCERMECFRMLLVEIEEKHRAARAGIGAAS